eukprot:Em0010g904a
MSGFKTRASYVFDDLSFKQAEDMLRRHGNNGVYLVSHFHDPESFGVSIRLREGEEVVYKHYPVCIAGQQLYADGVSGAFRNVDDVVEAIEEHVSSKLTPIFNLEEKSNDLSLTLSCDEPPPEYNKASKFPVAAKQHLPLIVPIRPTLRRMMGSLDPNSSSSMPEELDSNVPRVDISNHSCCWKTFHTDPEGAWYKPHKAGIVTAIFLVLGWIVFLALFGWIIALALILVFILVMCAYLLNFICTGRCQIEEDDPPTSVFASNVR